MGKNPCFLFYPTDWDRDMGYHPLDKPASKAYIECNEWRLPFMKPLTKLNDSQRLTGTATPIPA